jgi:hypothetical protein
MIAAATMTIEDLENPMRTMLVLVSALSLILQAGVVPARADDKSDAVAAAAAAAAILGVAALAHNEHHHRDKRYMTDSKLRASFERGYRDGLHGVSFDPSHSDAYAAGYAAGVRERDNSLAYKRHATANGPQVPSLAIRGCVGIVAQNFGVNPHHVHVTGMSRRGKNDFLVEAAVGHDHMTCEMDAAGDVLDVRGGRM